MSYSSLTAYVGESFILSTTVLPDDAVNKNFTWSSTNPSVAIVDVNGNVAVKALGIAGIIATTEVGGITDTCTVTVKSTEELILPGEFSVGSTNKVRFSRGNLYYDGIRHCIEEHQYDTTPTSETERDNNHISHFMWCDNAANARALKYNDGWNGVNKLFFAASGFTVNGYSGWRTLSNAEWEYLLDKRKTKYGTGELSESNHRYAAVKVNGMAGLLIFPDDFSSWPSGAGSEPTVFDDCSNNWNNRNYTVDQFTVLQNNGCVFLPAAGCRNSLNGNAIVNSVGGNGYYWSASPNDDYGAFGLNFGSGSVKPKYNDTRLRAQSVRLVTDAK